MGTTTETQGRTSRTEQTGATSKTKTTQERSYETPRLEPIGYQEGYVTRGGLYVNTVFYIPARQQWVVEVARAASGYLPVGFRYTVGVNGQHEEPFLSLLGGSIQVLDPKLFIAKPENPAALTKLLGTSESWNGAFIVGRAPEPDAPVVETTDENVVLHTTQIQSPIIREQVKVTVSTDTLDDILHTLKQVDFGFVMGAVNYVLQNRPASLVRTGGETGGAFAYAMLTELRDLADQIEILPAAYDEQTSKDEQTTTA
jgi:hypothetical protein